MAWARAAARSRGHLFALVIVLAVSCELLRLSRSFISASVAAQVSRLAPRVKRHARGGEAADVTYAVGDRVKAQSPDDELWYPGRITDDNHDGTWVVKWDQPDGGPETNSLGQGSLKKLIIFNGYEVGDDCRAISPDDLNWYPGSVVEVLGNNLFKVKWDDPDGGDETADVDAEFMKKVLVFKGYKPRDRVLAKYPDDGNMYDATVMRESDEGAFWVKWDDPEGGPEESLVNTKDMKYPPIPFEKLEVGQKYTGTVTRIKDFGAFVDIGSEGQGLLHISRIAVEHVNSVYDYLEEGQEVDVWICGLRPDEKKYGLTMVEGQYDRGGGRFQRQERRDLSPFLDVPPGRWLEGEVQGIRSYGCFVTVWLDNGVTGRGLINLKDMGPGFIEKVPDDILVGQAVKVQIVSLDVEAGRMSLRLQPPDTSHVATAASACAAFAGIGSSTWLTGRVVKILSGYGAILAVQAPGSDQTAQGLVHVTQIREGYIDRVEDELQVGEEVKVRVIEVDTVADRMQLSMKLDGSESLEARLSAFKDLDPSTWLTGRVTKIITGGAFVRVQEPTQASGFVQISEIREEFLDRVEDELSAGQQVKVRVIRVEPAEGQLDFSLKPAIVSA